MLKIVRTITANYCIPAHLDNTLTRIPNDVLLFVLGENVEMFSSKYQNVKFVNFPIKRNFSPFHDLLVVIRLFIWFRKNKPDIVHSIMTKSGLLSAIAGRLAGIKVRIHTFTGQVWSDKKGLIKFILISMDKIICLFNTDCLTDSPSQSNLLYHNGIHKNNNVLKCISKGSLSGVDLKRFSNGNILIANKKLKLEFSIKDDEYIIGYIARKSLVKGCIDMLKIFSKINLKFPNARLLFIGPDESKGLVSDYYKYNPQVREKIIDLGFINQHENYLSLCNVLCLPSYREGFGSIVIDAAAMQIPTIGYKIPGLVDSIKDGVTGSLINKGDIENFTNELMDFITDQKKTKFLGKNAREYAEQFFDADKINYELYSYYRKFV